jgi:hypothetical protein
MADNTDCQIMADSLEQQIRFCHHKNVVPIEFGFFRKTWPNGYKQDPDYGPTNVVGADTVRVRSYLCLDCKCEIIAPNSGQCKKDRF